MQWIKRIFYGLLKAIAYLLLFIVVAMVISFGSSFLLSTWTPDSGDKIYSICYVAVENEKQFVKFKHLANQLPTHQENLSKKEGFDHWELTTDNQIKTVSYQGDDYASWFRYRLHDKQIEPLSCRVFNIGNGMMGFWFTIFLFMLVDWGRQFYRWRKARQLRKNNNSHNSRRL